jgi:hypothetical protein
MPGSRVVDEESNTSRFNRDAPSRRSMSEKRTKIGTNGVAQSHTSSSISKFQRNAFAQKSLEHFTSGSNPKRSQTINIFPNASTVSSEFKSNNKIIYYFISFI